jgi:hypothetical protein
MMPRYRLVLIIKKFKEFSDVNVTIEFGAHPEPRPQDVIWVVKNADKTDEVNSSKHYYYYYSLLAPLRSAFSRKQNLKKCETKIRKKL